MGAAISQSQSSPDLAQHRHRVAELVAACSIEISPRDDFAGERLRELLDRGAHQRKPRLREMT